MRKYFFQGLFLLILLFAKEVTACSCIGETTIEKSVKGSDLVASGKVIGMETVWIPDSILIKEMTALGMAADSMDKRMFGYYINKVVFEVNKVYKGNKTMGTFTIYTGMGGGDCGYRFKEGETYIVYGEKESYLGAFTKNELFPESDRVYWTNICMRTQLHNEKEMKDLERVSK